MSKVILTQKPSVLPWYAAALVFAVLCAALPAYKLWALLIALGGAAVMFGAAKKVCLPRVVEHEVPFHTGSGDVDEMLADIQQKLDALHALNEALPDPELSAAMTRMEKAGRSIVETVEASPAKAKQVRRFANYYLPDAVNVLEQYAKLARQGVRGENAASIRAEVERNAASIATAFENQLDALYAAESMDLSADLTVLQNMMEIRGRVGRSERGAYAYLLYKKDKSIQDDALKRLKAIKEFTELGSGYKIAMRDLSIRGSGDILGGKQAGFIDDIGFEMYMKILQDAINVRMHKDEKPEEEVKNLNVSVDGYIPDDYVESDYEKLELYQRLDKAKTMSELNSLKAEFDDYYGNLPEAILTLIEKRKLEILSHYSIIEDIKDSGKQLEIIFSPNAFETISGDKLFLLANQLFTKPAFKSLDNKITIKINKHDQWLNRLNEFIETLSKK